MSTVDPKQRKDDEKDAQEDRIQYVEELASALEYPEGDAWISLTDAARITRTSEAMTRRWVTSGRLKVKKEAVGIPPRTRLVRLSDVAAIRPIVDPTAAITGEVRKLDLPSIPRQQLQIMQDHQKLLTQITTFQETVEQTITDLGAQLRRDLNSLEARTNARHEKLASELTTGLTEASTQLATQVQEVRTLIQEEQTARAQGLDALGKQLTQTSDELVGRLDAHDQHFQILTTQRETEQQAQQQHVEDVDTALERIQDDMQRQGRELVAQLETLERDQARDVATLTQQLEAIDSKLARIVTETKNGLAPVQKRVEAQEQQIRALSQEVQQERATRESLSITLEAQREQLEALHDMVEVLTKRKKV